MARIHEVAARAGVSVATVSRVFNKQEIVKKETLEKVIAAAEELNYQPNSVARSLVSGKSGVVGLIVPDITNPYFAYISRGCSDELNKQQITLALYNSDEQSSREDYMLRLINQRQADGLIVTSETASVSTAIQNLSFNKLPTVYIERRPDEPNIDAVYLDNRLAAHLAVQHLLKLNHKKIAIITGLMNTVTGLERFQGFAETLVRADIPLPDEYIIQSNFKLEGGVSAAHKILALSDPPTAVFISSDLMAYGAIGEFVLNNRKVPEDISVVGCEDLPFSSYFSPSLTTIHVPIYELGKRGAQLLIKRLEKPSRKSNTEVLNVQLVIRHSTCQAVK